MHALPFALMRHLSDRVRRRRSRGLGRRSVRHRRYASFGTFMEAWGTVTGGGARLRPSMAGYLLVRAVYVGALGRVPIHALYQNARHRRKSSQIKFVTSLYST